MNSINEKKQILRSTVLSRRLEFSEKDWREKSDRIISHLINFDFFRQSKVVHTYLSMNNRKEVCTDGLLTNLLELSKKVIVPVTNFEEHKLIHSEIHSLADLTTNKWGVREPKEINPIDVDKMDFIVVPMNAADKKGNRLGYGKGFYDRFLSQVNAFKAGLIFEDFIFEEIPAEEYDVKMNVLITEKGVFKP